MKKKQSKLKLNLRYNRFETPLDNYYVGCQHPTLSKDLRKYKARIKCRLIHGPGRSVILPDFLLLSGGWIQPLQFTPNLINIGNGQCVFNIDISGEQTIKVTFNSKEPLQLLPDNSQIYQCTIDGPKEINKHFSGDYLEDADMIYLGLYHHTDDKGREGILSSKYLRDCNYNIKGSKTSEDTSFVYFTQVSQIKKNGDLKAVAMTHDDPINYQVDSHRPSMVLFPGYIDQASEFIYQADVYKRSVEALKRSLKFYIPIHFIDVKHLFIHPEYSTSVYYEIFAPLIQRVRIKPKDQLHFDKDHKILLSNDVAFSDYLIEGDASNVKGLAAPFDEDHKLGYAVIQNLGNENLAEYWKSHANMDLFSGVTISPAMFI